MSAGPYIAKSSMEEWKVHQRMLDKVAEARKAQRADMVARSVQCDGCGASKKADRRCDYCGRV